ncbi:MAG: hypothetical protein JO126_01135 [Alphaproteobacteria bacterium]|nr:hypothetical protein [Alphaproteobacteria bacterium]MBV8548044.1 hypothetical protein [Alphaproteobacteria bacterium]
MRCSKIYSLCLKAVTRAPRETGIAIGPILFVLAILGILAAVLSIGSSDFSIASVADRLQADIPAQANLIRAKIMECNLKYGTNSNYDGYPSSDATNGTLVSALTCTGDTAGLQGLWTGARPAYLPPPSTGMGQWYYINTNATGQGGTATGGRCIWFVPTISNPVNNKGVVTGLTKAAARFTNAVSNDGASEVNYNPAGTTQRFVMWITLPTGTADPHCTP